MNHAYGLNGAGLNGAGTLIAIIVASDQPSIQSDVHNFDMAFGLPDPPALNVFAPFGHINPPPPAPDWPIEITLDVQWAHASAPAASIAVVEAATDRFQIPTPQVDLLGAVGWAVVNLNPDVVSMSWGADERTWAAIYGNDFESRFDPQFFPSTNGAGRPVAYLASDGDSGFQTNYPAVSTGVVGVGGTSLAPSAFGYPSVPGAHFDCSGASAFGVNQQNETVWGAQSCTISPPFCEGTGGGPSFFELRPTWQTGFGPSGNARLSPDVAMDADPNSGVALFMAGTWFPFKVGGTSLAAPLWAGVVASLDEERHLRGLDALSQSSSANWVYNANANDFNDIVTGNSPPAPGDPCIAQATCVAAPGYDEVTGRGSPKFSTLVADNTVAGLGPGSVQLSFNPTAPVRIMDTRTGSGGHVGPLSSGETFTLQVTGQNGVPGGAGAIAVNVGVTNSASVSAGYVLLYPCQQPRPLASTVNFATNQTIAVLTQVQLGPGGCVNVYLNTAGGTGTAAVFLDLQGYFGQALAGHGLFNALSTPIRALDTRIGLGGKSTPFGPGQSFELQVAGNNAIHSSPAIPQSAESVVLNLTEVQGNSLSYLSAYPAVGGGNPCPAALTSSNLNFPPGRVLANRVTVQVGVGGNICFYNSQGSVDVLADLAGWYSSGQNTDNIGAQYSPMPPTRIYDSRLASPLGPGQGSCPSTSGNRDVVIPPAVGSALAVSITALDATVSTYLEEFPAGNAPNPPTSDINFQPGDILPNLAISSVGTNHAVTICNSAGLANFFVDLNGGYS